MKPSNIFILLAAIAALALQSCQPTTGCTDNKAVNYNANATVSDGDCQYRQNQLAGAWAVEDHYNSLTCGTGSLNYPVTISPVIDAVMVVEMSNFAHLGTTVQITIENGDEAPLYVHSQTILVSGNVWNVSGTGIIYNNNYFTVNYNRYCTATGCNMSGTLTVTR